MMIKISVSFVFLVAPVVLAQYGSGGYDGGAQDSLDGFVSSAGYHRHRQHGSIQQQHQYNYQTYHTAQTSYGSGYQEVNFNRYRQNFADNFADKPAPTGPSYDIARAPQPVITKHIYFHLPPPDDSATVAPVTAAPPKKLYNIIFIKLPSQKSANSARIQQLINQQVAEDKTLIYVLVKKPELQDLQAIQPVTSKPEVFFVKYKEPRSVALQVGDATGPPAPAGGGAGLRPGLVNGYWN